MRLSSSLRCSAFILACVLVVPATSAWSFSDPEGDVEVRGGPGVTPPGTDGFDVTHVELELVDNSTLAVHIEVVDLRQVMLYMHRYQSVDINADLDFMGTPYGRVLPVAHAQGSPLQVETPWFFLVYDDVRPYGLKTTGEIDLEGSVVRIDVDLERYYNATDEVKIRQAWGRGGGSVDSVNGGQPSMWIDDVAYSPQPWNILVRPAIMVENGTTVDDLEDLDEEDASKKSPAGTWLLPAAALLLLGRRRAR